MKFYPIPCAVYYYNVDIFSTNSLYLVGLRYSFKIEIFERVDNDE
tara:strand:+ start:309 stop:443 length:135 start_codon:yes stop_codon:yes gene_type:complete